MMDKVSYYSGHIKHWSGVYPAGAVMHLFIGSTRPAYVLAILSGGQFTSYISVMMCIQSLCCADMRQVVKEF